MDARNVARLKILAAAAIFSTGGALIKSCAFSGLQVAALRSAVAAAALWAMVPAARRGWTRMTILAGLAYAATLALFVTANKLTTAASAIYLQSTAPLYLLLLAPWVLGESLSRRDLPFMAALGVGLLLLVAGAGPARATATNPRLGNLLAAGSGLSWALTLLGLRWLGKSRSGGAAAAIAGNILVALACIPASWPLPAVPAADWLRIAFLGAVQVGVAYKLVAEGLQEVPALESSLLVLLEPVLNPVWAWLVHGESMGGFTLAGAATILVATAWHVVSAGRPRRPEVPCA